MAVALVALFLALAGTGMAASRYIINSKGQINPKVVRELRGQNGRNGNPGPQGPAGPQGPGGPQGPAGPVNLGSIVRTAQGPTRYAGPGEAVTSLAVCPSGYNVISGGYTSVGVPNEVFIDTWNTSNSWAASISFTGTGTAHVTAQAFCAPAGQAVAASVRHPGLSPRVLKLIAAEKARLSSLRRR
jgi:hypothetical protein